MSIDRGGGGSKPEHIPEAVTDVRAVKENRRRARRSQYYRYWHQIGGKRGLTTVKLRSSHSQPSKTPRKYTIGGTICDVHVG